MFVIFLDLYLRLLSCRQTEEEEKVKLEPISSSDSVVAPPALAPAAAQNIAVTPPSMIRPLENLDWLRPDNLDQMDLGECMLFIAEQLINYLKIGDNVCAEEYVPNVPRRPVRRLHFGRFYGLWQSVRERNEWWCHHVHHEVLQIGRMQSTNWVFNNPRKVQHVLDTTLGYNVLEEEVEFHLESINEEKELAEEAMHAYRLHQARVEKLSDKHAKCLKMMANMT